MTFFSYSRGFAVLMGFGIYLCAQAQTSPVQPVDPEAYARINAQYAELDQQMATAQKNCSSRFAVSDCINKAETQDRHKRAELRQQELVLKDQDRQAKAAQRLQAIQDKAAAQAAKAQNAQVPPKPAEVKIHQRASEPARSNVQDRQERVRRKQDDQAQRDSQAAQALAETQGKQAQAEQRRREHAQREAQRTKPPARGLPTP